VIVLLGGHGDIGSVVATQLRDAGNTVVAPNSKQLDLTDLVAAAAFFRSLTGEYDLMFFAFKDRASGETQQQYDANRWLVNNVLKFARPSSMLFASSIAVYGDRPLLPISENSPLIGEGFYAEAKREAENLIVAESAGKYASLLVRLPGVFGGRGKRGQSFDRILRNGLETRIIELGGNGNVLRDWVSATEVADFTSLFVRKARSGLVNFVRGESLKIDDYVETALEVLPQIQHRPGKLSESREASDFIFDAAALQNLYPEWRFPNRKRDIHALALELKQLREYGEMS